MSVVEPQPAAPEPTSRWYRLTPGRCIVGLLAVEGLLFLAERFCWFPKGYAVLIAVAAVGVAFLVMLLWFAVAVLFRWRFQYSIRSLLLLPVVVAIPCSWLAVERKKAKEQEETVEAIKKLRGIVDLSYPSRPDCLRDLLGYDFFDHVESVNFIASELTDAGLDNLAGLKQLRKLNLSDKKVTDAGLERLKGLKQLIKLNLRYTNITDAGLKQLKGLGQLQYLDLTGTMVTEAGLEHLKGLNQLRFLCLDETSVTDAGLEHLMGLKQLQCLGLRSTKVTDAGLENLKGLNQLQSLGLDDTKVTDQGVKKLQQALPNCKIFH